MKFVLTVAAALTVRRLYQEAATWCERREQRERKRQRMEDSYSHPWLYCLGESARGPLSRYGRMMGLSEDPTALKLSWDLLMDHLDEKQRKDIVDKGQFTVTTSRGSTCLIVATWSHVNVTENADTYPRRWCTSASVRELPLWDHILAQVLAIKYNWEYFQEKAVYYG